MPSKEKHKDMTRKLFGRPYSHVHGWIDQPAATLGPHHRKSRHNLIFSPVIASFHFKDPKVYLVSATHILQDRFFSWLHKNQNEIFWFLFWLIITTYIFLKLGVN